MLHVMTTSVKIPAMVKLIEGVVIKQILHITSLLMGMAVNQAIMS